jgi:STE24 endopeptidase
MSAETLMIIFLLIISIEFIFEKTLGFLNYSNLKNELPMKLRNIYDEDKYKQSIAYNRENAKFGFITSILSFVLIFILIITGFFGSLDVWVRSYFDHEIVISLIFFAILFFASDILSTPFTLYDTFVIEEKYGFNKTTAKIFIADKLKGYILAILIGGILISALLMLIQFMGQHFWIYFWIVIAGFSIFMNVFYTSLIVPLFNKLVPLNNEELKTAILDYSKGVKFPLDNVFMIDGSKRSTKANAYFSGFGKKKKIVLFDTLIKNHTTDELVAVLAHEVGHYKKKHVILGLVSSILQAGLMLFIMSLMIFNPVLSEAFGGSQMSIHLNLLAFFILFSPISHITGIIMNLVSRKNEYSADKFAALTFKSEPLQEALIKLSVNNLGNLTPHPWYVFVNYAHPSLLARLDALEHYNK